MQYLIEVSTAFIGTLGFSIIFNSKKSMLFILALGGGIVWASYMLANSFIINVPTCYFISSVIAGIYAEIFARIKKTPVTTVLIPVLIPLIPGGSLYYTMRYAFNNEMNNLMINGAETIKIALSIALGIILVSTVVKVISNNK